MERLVSVQRDVTSGRNHQIPGLLGFLRNLLFFANPLPKSALPRFPVHTRFSLGPNSIWASGPSSDENASARARRRNPTEKSGRCLVVGVGDGETATLPDGHLKPMMRNR